MSDILLYSAIGILLLVAGFLLGRYIQLLKTRTSASTFEEREKQLNNRAESLEKQLVKQGEETDSLRRDREDLQVQLARNEVDTANLRLKQQEQKEEMELLQEKFTKEFENLANKILDEKSQKFTKQNRENIENILTPLKEKIKTFEDKVEKSQKENISIHAALREQLQTLQNQNLKITQEAENLTKALKGDSKTQGNWGELVLERVLEKSGLEKDREYTVQKSFTLEDGSRVLPDVIIHLPNGKKMIVDSKVSLTDYERYTNADEILQEKHLKDHINSLNKHVEQLSAKKYEDLYEIESPDFVLMFIPVEPAFAVALNRDSKLYTKAFEKNIVIVTPTTLLATLRTIDTWWNNEKQQRNALEIARQAGALYDKFEGLIKDLTSVGKKMDDAKGEYQEAMKKLYTGHGNLISRVERLKKLGAKAKKTMPEPILRRAKENDLEEEPSLN